MENTDPASSDGRRGPLASVRILDLSNMGMGPYATSLMAELGAEVVKIEPPEGDPIRGVGPMHHPGMASTFLLANRNKRSLVLDLKRPEGQAVVHKLIESFDVLFFNMRPPAMARLGLDYERVARINPRIIYCGAYGFRQDGPYAEKPAYDDMIQGLTALPYLEGRLTGTPRYIPLAIADQTVGVFAAYAVLAALVSRASTGRGQAVEVPMFETMAQFVLLCHMCGQMFDPPLGPTGFVRHLTPHRRPFPTTDGHISLVPYNDAQWFRLFDVMGKPELKSDPRFCNITDRTNNIGELYRIVAESLATRATAEWMADFERADIPAMPMHTLDSLLADPHLNATGFLGWETHPTEGRVRALAPSSRWMGTPPASQCPAPRLGEHSVEVLREAGFPEDAIASLGASGVLRTAG